MRHTRPARCKGDGCDAPIVFFRSPYTGNLRAFNATPIDGHHPHAVAAFPVMGRTAFKFPVLVELIQVQRECTDVEAETEVRDMPWHSIHECDHTSHTDTKETPNP